MIQRCERLSCFTSVGRKFLVSGFDRYGFVELQVSDDPAVKRKFGLNSIWMQPGFLELITKTKRKLTGRPMASAGRKTSLRLKQWLSGAGYKQLEGEKRIAVRS
jgi:hypothetical protein